MEKEIVKNSLDRYLKGESSAQEQAAVETWYNRISDQKGQTVEIDYDRHYTRLRQALPGPNAVKVIRLWPRIVAAAIALIIFGGGLFYYFSSKEDKELPNTQYVQDVNPGRQGATLTLANGIKIKLSEAANGQIASQAGVSIRKTADGKLVYEIRQNERAVNQVNTIATSNGETYQVKLPDGSDVWLNSASSLTYNASLIRNGKRTVKLTGEGYFEIAKDRQHPFIVESGNQQVEVLGTHFNINSYTDESAITTTLLEGSVEVQTPNTKQNIKPGEQAANLNGKISTSKVDTETIIDWKENEFNLDDVDFRVAMRKIARWYDIEVVYDPSVPLNMKAGGWIPRNSKLSAVLNSIENSGLARFKVEGRKVTVYK